MGRIDSINLKITRPENAQFYNVRIDDVVVLDMETYVGCVVATEIGNSHLEACKAQAVAVRTNAYTYVEKNTPIPDVNVQAFRSCRLDKAKYPNAYQGTKETVGEVLSHKGVLLSPCAFSSSNGGRTTSSESRWGGYRSFLIEQDDPWDYAATQGKKRGHGVGMSQEGAKYAAKIGVSFRDILSFYYPNTTVESMKGAGDSMAIKASYQVEKFKYMADQGWDYVAGGASKGAVDCSGSFTYWYKQAGGYMYHGSNTMWRKYSTEKGKIGSINLVPGMAVYKWRNDGKEPSSYQDDGIGNFYHVGLYIGNNRVVEAKGTKYGVVYSDIDQWTHASRQKNTEYDMAESASSDSNSTSMFPIEGKVETSGGVQRVRKAPVDGDVLGKLSNGAVLTLIGETDGWYHINYKGHIGYVSGDYVSLSSGWKIIVSVNNTASKDKIVSYLKDNGYNPSIKKIGG